MFHNTKLLIRQIAKLSQQIKITVTQRESLNMQLLDNVRNNLRGEKNGEI